MSAAHATSCRWNQTLAAVDCTCGVITDADILRAQLMGHPLPGQKSATFMGMEMREDPTLAPDEFRLVVPKAHA